MIALNIILGLAAAVLFLGVVAEENERIQGNVTIAFVAMLLFIVSVNIIA